MKRSESDNKKMRQRPTTGGGQRWHGSDLKKIDNWAIDKGVTRSEAIRRLVAQGLLKLKTKIKR